MSKLHFLRRPLGLILYSLLLALTTSAALIFSLQAHMDGAAMEEALNAFSFIGTLHPTQGQTGQVSSEVLILLEDSELVDQVEVQDIRSAKVLDRKTIPDFMITTRQIHQHYFVEGRVAEQLYFDTGSYSTVEIYRVTVDRQWGGDTLAFDYVNLSVIRGPDKQTSYLEPGQRIFFVGEFTVAYAVGAVGTNNTTAYTADGLDAMGLLGQSALADSGILLIPDGLSEEETEDFILQHMTSTGILDYYEIYRDTRNMVPLRYIQDFSMLPRVAENYIYISEGRALTREDIGKKVCLVSQNFSLKNRLVVGQTIGVAVGDGSYILDGYESGYPSELDRELVRYGEYEEYEIVGFYNQLGRDSADHYFFDHNTIFLPGGADGEMPMSYSLSFRVLGPAHEEFMSRTVPELSRLGYETELVDSGWYEVESSFQAMLERRELMLVCAAVCYGVAVLLLVLLLLGRFRYDYGLSRLLGAYRREAVSVYLSGFLLTALPGCAAALGAAWLVYDRWLRDTMTLEGVEKLLLGWAAGELALALLLLLGLVLWADRRRLLKMVR